VRLKQLNSPKPLCHRARSTRCLRFRPASRRRPPGHGSHLAVGPASISAAASEFVARARAHHRGAATVSVVTGRIADARHALCRGPTTRPGSPHREGAGAQTAERQRRRASFARPGTSKGLPPRRDALQLQGRRSSKTDAEINLPVEYQKTTIAPPSRFPAERSAGAVQLLDQALGRRRTQSAWCPARPRRTPRSPLLASDLLSLPRAQFPLPMVRARRRGGRPVDAVKRFHRPETCQ